MDVDRSESERGYAYLWLRQAKPYAGEAYGWHTPLIDGTEVAVAYHNGDLDLPYIAQALHDSAHPDPVTRDNRSQNILRTPADNVLQMEDRRGKEHIHLATEFGTSQLGQGHLTDEQQKPRGTGFELRTDEHGVIRVAKGLFISADGQARAQGEVLERATALKEIDCCLHQIQQLAAAAEQAQALKADIDSQLAMFEQRLTPLNDLIHFSAPQGMAFASGEHLQLAASNNVAINAGGDIAVGVMGNMTALAGEKLGLFARTGQLSLKASAGPIEIQAQNGTLQLFAEKTLSISAAENIAFTGKKRITLIGGGSYLKLEQGKIEYGSTGQYLRKAKRIATLGRAAMPLDLPRMGTAYRYSALYQLQDKQGTVLVNTPYRLTTASGQTITGYSDHEGRSVPAYTRQPEEVALHILQKEPQPEETLWFVGESAPQTVATELKERRSS